jgi:uncharacterized protein
MGGSHRRAGALFRHGSGMWTWMTGLRRIIFCPSRRVSSRPPARRSARGGGVSGLPAGEVWRGTAADALAAVAIAVFGILSPGIVAAGEVQPVKTLIELRQDRVVVQEWDISCGAAALATILKYQYGEDLEDLTEREIARGLIKREEYLANPQLVRMRHGFSLLDLKRFVGELGYHGIGYGQMTLQDLVERAPVLIPVRLNGYDHFVVFRGVRGNRVVLADPAWGNRTMTVSKFERAWLEYSKMGKIGFVVVRDDGANQVNRLAPRHNDFVFLR